ncbi:MAG: ADP-ribosylglycohydrolase family protein [Alphaproteobacteria bacterium]
MSENVECARGCLWGLVVGDALGAPFEGRPQDSFPLARDMRAGGADIFPLAPGDWTDDTAMALCLADVLLHSNGFDEERLMYAFGRWLREGENSCHGIAYGIGRNTRHVIRDYLKNGTIIAAKHEGIRSDGNGSLMRLAPIPSVYWGDLRMASDLAERQSRVTHASDLAANLCRAQAELCCRLIQGSDWNSATAFLEAHDAVDSEIGIRPNWRELSRTEIRASGQAKYAFEASLWCVEHTSSFEDAVIKAVNLGGDTDTVGAITGQIAGAAYGYGSIPVRWLEAITHRKSIAQKFNKLIELSHGH